MAKQGRAGREIVRELVMANHILYREGVLDGFGHVSARDARDPGRFHLSRSIAPGRVTARDIMAFDLEARPLVAHGGKPYVERFIHSEIYRARPDVQAIVHSHSPAVIPYGVTRVPLRPLYHMSGFLASGVPVFEIRDAGGTATDMLVRDARLGAALAATLGGAAFALMRGHGAVAVGDSIRQVVFRAIYAEMNARLQSEAMRLGSVTFLNDAEAAAAAAANDQVLDRPWELWRDRLRRNR